MNIGASHNVGRIMSFYRVQRHMVPMAATTNVQGDNSRGAKSVEWAVIEVKGLYRSMASNCVFIYFQIGTCYDLCTVS